ncbi:MAG: NAD(P)/FAD-dependent oxidoreductase [Sporomusaceae bacterium]|nr:NAD(P)/FAD-dependent oxidoreductase [Sporomusaceae bacterium]
MKKILVIGGGAAGLMAAASAAEHGADVTLLEKMPAVGRKLLITGKGRCNVTNIADIKTIIDNMPGNGPFLHSALAAFSNNDLMAWLEKRGVPLKTERGGRVFPVSDQARDVVDAFARALADRGVSVVTGQAVREIRLADGRACGAATADGREWQADAVILAAGGASYPGTGSSGDGYRIAAALGHAVTPLRPSLVPLEVAEDWITDLQGLALKNVAVAAIAGGRQLAAEFGELLFTHFGLSGPVILSLSNPVAAALRTRPGDEVLIAIDLKPALSAETLDKRLQRDFVKFARKQFKNSLGELLPSRLTAVIVDLSHIDPDKPVHQITKEERARLAGLLKQLTFTVTGTRPLAEAIVTAGGISTKEINPSTMASRLVPGLYFAGEVIDIDGYTGGFNLQAAFSTGYVAGRAAAADNVENNYR